MTGKKTTFRDREKLDLGQLEPAPGTAQARASRDPGSRPGGYGDALLWDMSLEFERLAYKHRVGLGGRGVPYIYKALAQSVDRSGMRDMECRDGNAKLVRGAELGVRLIRFFWDQAPWDRDGDVISQFADPMMFEDCLAEMVKRWHSQRLHKAFQARVAEGIEYTPFQRVDKPAIGFKTWRNS